MTVRYIKYVANIFGLDKMSSDTVYSNLLCDFVISGAINYKKFGSVKVKDAQRSFRSCSVLAGLWENINDLRLKFL